MERKPDFVSDRPVHAISQPRDPLSQLVALLRPRALLTDLRAGEGQWTTCHVDGGLSGFCIALEGRSQLQQDGGIPQVLYTNDFALLPATSSFALSGITPDMRAVTGVFRFDGLNPTLLVALLPQVVHLRGSGRLSQLIALVDAETRDELAGCDSMLAALAGMLLVEAMRQTTVRDAPPGLLRGLGDAQLAPALVELHSRLSEPWTVERLARAAHLSRSAFHDRFTAKVGMAPMEYLQYWRIEIAKDLLRSGGLTVPEVASRVGYRSCKAFSLVFARQVGQSPARYARAVACPQCASSRLPLCAGRQTGWHDTRLTRLHLAERTSTPEGAIHE